MLPAELSDRLQNHLEQRDFSALEALLLQSLEKFPDEADLHHLLGWLRAEQRRLAEAIAQFREAIRLKPDAAGSLNNLAAIYLHEEKFADALPLYEAAVRHQPHYVAALANLGFTRAQLGQFQQALPVLFEALRLDPENADVRHHLGYALMSVGRLIEAELHLLAAVQQQPTNAGFQNTLGLLRSNQHRLEEAETLFRTAIRLSPNLAEAWNNLGNIQAAVWANWSAALECFERAVALKPKYIDAVYHRGMTRLMLGDFSGGWADYESRPAIRQKSPLRYHRPRWRGERLVGKTILLHVEQGLGDTLQFIRYAQVLRDRGATVVCEVQRPLLPLLSRMPGIDQLLADGDTLPAHDFQIPLLSLPQYLAIPENQPPYLRADPDRIAFWKPRLAAIPGRKIGIAWQGDPKFKYDWLRSVPLSQFAPLTRLPDVTLISLQKHHGVEQIAANRNTVHVVELTPEIDTTAGPFVDTAAIIMHLDLVITSDTALAHLAGGLGVPVWLATSYAPEWRWLTDRDDSPWYPSMRLFRQTQFGRWDDVFDRMSAALLASPQPPAPSP